MLPSTLVAAIVIFFVPSNSVAVPVTAPEIPIVRAVVNLVALRTFLLASAVLSTLPKPISSLVISIAVEPL